MQRAKSGRQEAAPTIAKAVVLKPAREVICRMRNLTFQCGLRSFGVFLVRRVPTVFAAVVWFAIYCLLPTFDSRQPTAGNLIPTAYCLLPCAYSSQPGANPGLPSPSGVSAGPRPYPARVRVVGPARSQPKPKIPSARPSKYNRRWSLRTAGWVWRCASKAGCLKPSANCKRPRSLILPTPTRITLWARWHGR